MRLENKIALVTGASRGIGQAIVQRFLEEGATLAIVQRSAPDVEILAHPRVHFFATDLACAESLQQLLPSIEAQLGGLDILVNNAGVMFEQRAEDTSLSDWQRMLDINLTAPFILCQQAVPMMRARGGGAVVNISSIEGIGANPGHTAYAASKAGLTGLTVALAIDHGAEGIRANCICPGWIETDLNRAYVDTRPDKEAVVSELARLHPVGRLGTPQDIANMALFLASDESAFITGQAFVVDGGRTKKLPLPAMLDG